ncbi:2-hydroxyacylsphingosine 1-beta-galactosyltransferase [Trachymyrmex cornetzi]|uniref:UDP-glucuronosyltransferase n=1 Tax=Trachymyrmex cornetzi TaxID=471704 RepID=A0A151IZH6_9HYME|nr:2-hydroxyacylsphingosine 1-beta-galactosyltransferase [Trachymyrmex cornetzi]
MDSIGNPDDPNFNPDMTYPFTNRMTINERIMNILYTTYTRLYYRYWHLPNAQRMANKRTPGTSVYDIDKNFSLVILGNNHVFGYPKPLLPHVIEVHSLHILENPGSLPKDIHEFLDNAQDGAIYFSLGSNLQTDQLPAGPLTALCNALGSLKQRVLWKHNSNMAIHATNIKFVKWVPQQAVLAHPKVIAYMMQGGLQSLQEAVHYAVPVVAIPFFGDQYFNARKILDASIGLTLDIDTITENSIVQTLTEIVKNKTNPNLKPAFFSKNKLNKFIKVQKDVLPKNSNKNVVYKIECKKCDATYVGQICRKLYTRIAEHRNHINWNTNSQSVITDYRLEYNHEFDWKNVKILGSEKTLRGYAYLHDRKNTYSWEFFFEKI